jgi:hypothetical protein
MKWLTNYPSVKADEYIKEIAFGRKLRIGDPMPSECLTVEQLLEPPEVIVGIYEVD